MVKLGVEMAIHSAQLAAMKAMVDQHEKYVRRDSTGRKLVARYTNWSGAVFQKRCFDDADLTGADLSHAFFAASSFKLANLYCCDLTGSDFRATNLCRADLRGSILREANFFGAILDGADFRDATLVRADNGNNLGSPLPMVSPDKHTSQLRKVDFRDCSLKKANLASARLEGADFSGSILRGANLSGAALQGATFADAVLEDVDLRMVRIDPAGLQAAVLPPGETVKARAGEIRERIGEAEQWSATHGRSGTTLELAREDLRPLSNDFAGKQLHMSVFENCLMLGGNFTNALMACSRFVNCDLRDADFRSADLRGVQFIDCRLNFARFEKCQVGGVKIGDGQIQTTNFENCRSAGARLPDSACDPVVDLDGIISFKASA
jgi:uncharacterized protein YjbI with pentapeptide repeats